MRRLIALAFLISLAIWGRSPLAADGCWGQCLPGGACYYEACLQIACIHCYYSCPDNQGCEMMFCEGEPSETFCDEAAQ